MITVTRIKVFDDAWNSVRAVADASLEVATVPEGVKGKIDINGLRIMQGKDGQGHWVSPPAKQGQTKWFDIVTVSGPLWKAVCEAVLLKYVEALAERSRASAGTATVTGRVP